MSVLAAGSAALTRAALSRPAWLADDTDVGDERHKAGPIAILVIVVLCVACFVLFRSMTKHLRNVREEFPEPPAGGDLVDHTADTAASAPAPTAAPAPGSTRASPKTRPRTSGDPHPG